MPATAHLICLRDGERLGARPIRPSDKDALTAFFARLSPQSRHRRFLAPKPSLTSRDLVFLTEVDGHTHVALVVLDRDGDIVAVGRYAGWRDRPERAEIAFAVADDWQGRGLGTALGERLVELARHTGVATLTGSTLAENGPARKLLRHLGFRHVGYDGAVADYELALAPPAAPALPAAA
jgi:RimJ/RimL family protein N-acetyltransferase